MIGWRKREEQSGSKERGWKTGRRRNEIKPGVGN